jgi:hypothetical protein
MTAWRVLALIAEMPSYEVEVFDWLSGPQYKSTKLSLPVIYMLR